MDHQHEHHDAAHDHEGNKTSVNRLAASATLHCLTGCAIGEVLGMAIGTALGVHNLAMTVLAIVLAFIFGYSLSILPVLRAGVPVRKALTLVLASDTLSITVMEITDNTVFWLVPGAVHASLTSWLFWVSMSLALFVAFWAAFPVNRWLLQRGKGHALLHEYHH